MKKEVYNLKNGLKVVLNQDLRKKSTFAKIIVKYGDINNNFIYNDKEYLIQDGVAHFLEHLLLEHNLYGNLCLNFKNNYVDINGNTSIDTTNFYMNTVHDFYKYFKLFIKAINTPVFTEKDIEETKLAIKEEIRRSNDSKFKKMYVSSLKSLFTNINISNTVGDLSSLEKLDYNTVKLCYDIFYQPNNQIIVVSGNFDIDKVKKLIIQVYGLIDNKCNYLLKSTIEKEVVNKKTFTLKEDVEEEFIAINYKTNIAFLSSCEKVKLTFYIKYFLDYNFSETSKTYNFLIENKLSAYNISCNYQIINGFLIISVGTHTSDFEIFEDLVNNIMLEKPMDYEFFENCKRESIIDLLLREEDHMNFIGGFVDNIVSFNYEFPDEIKDIESYTYRDFMEFINKLSFKNYSVGKMIKK